jgi:energy-coupling factor transporter ATP-binding protein EcfA2
MAVIEVESQTRSYRPGSRLRRRSSKVVEAVRGISFAIERGELFGLLGPNGAGKTTTTKMLITLLTYFAELYRVPPREQAAAAEVEVFGSAGHALGPVCGLTGVTSILVEDRGRAQLMVVRMETGAEPTSAVLARLDGVPVGRVATREPALEDGYVELVGAGAPS